MPLRPACLLLASLAAACASKEDGAIEREGQALAGRIDAMSRPLREGLVADSLRHDLVALRDRSKSLASTEISRLPKTSSDVQAGLSSVGRSLDKLGGSLPKLASFLALPSRPLLHDPRDDEAAVGADRASATGGGLLGGLLQKIGF